MSFDALLAKKIKAPCAPILKSNADTANFDVEFTSCPVHSYEESPAGTIENDKFKDFSYGADVWMNYTYEISYLLNFDSLENILAQTNQT